MAKAAKPAAKADEVSAEAPEFEAAKVDKSDAAPVADEVQVEAPKHVFVTSSGKVPHLRALNARHQEVYAEQEARKAKAVEAAKKAIEDAFKS